MGIKGIYGEIGPGERVALVKLAVEHFERTGKPFRVAVDISIWQFQIQSGRGGTNPALRTLYFRLLRLLSLTIQPLFVFDGSQKPPFKRGKKMAPGGCSLPNYMTKEMLRLFGFQYHVAPGEAEAECALLQREGIVDAVLSEDVDTLMFGCGTTLRNWSAEGKRNIPTHVSLYDSKATKAGKAGLDRQGMILIALMSGGDYIVEGVPGCGIKVACEAARAGFGASLCRISQNDDAALALWRLNLCHELRTNESNFFRVKHKSLVIPDTFPNKEVLGYYTHPVVSSQTKVGRLRTELVWDMEIDIPALRRFVGDAFEWTGKAGAIKFIRGLAPALLVSKLRARVDRRASGFGDVILTASEEMELVKSIHARRAHFDTDGMPELRLIYKPLDMVPINLDEEPDDSENYSRNGLAPVDEEGNVEAYDEIEEPVASQSQSPRKRSSPAWDPTQPDKVWVPETMAKVGIPLKVEDYEESLRNPRKLLKVKYAKAKKPVAKGAMPQGALDKFFTVTKPQSRLKSPKSFLSVPIESWQPYTTLPAPPQQDVVTSPNVTIRKTTRKTKAKASKMDSPPMPKKNISNPWSSFRSKSSDIIQNVGIMKPGSININQQKEPIEIDSSPLLSRKHSRASSPLISSPQSQTISYDFHDHASPSPLKRRSPGSSCNKYRSPDLPSSAIIIEEEASMTGTKVNRKLDFSTPKLSGSSLSSSPDPEMPSHYDLRHPPMVETSPRHTKSQASRSFQKPIDEQVIDLLSSPPPVPKETSTNGKHAETGNHSAISPSDNLPSPIINLRLKGKKFLMPRQSLEGAWKEVDEVEKEQREKQATSRGKPIRAWRTSQVEVLDLTGED